jgi:hypothetical protein
VKGGPGRAGLRVNGEEVVSVFFFSRGRAVFQQIGSRKEMYRILFYHQLQNNIYIYQIIIK